MSNKKQYFLGLNSKGMPSRTAGNQAPTTKRGLRRLKREKIRHSHEFHVVQPRYQDSERQERETFYYCRCGYRTHAIS